MRRNLSMVFMLAAAIGLQSAAQGAEYFVSKKGNDANNGVTRATAFLTIQKGVDALLPGDTLTIGAGEYFESVFRAGLGNLNNQTIIRAEIPGTVLLRGDSPAPEFEKVPGFRFVYAAPFEKAPEAVLEHAAMKLLGQRPNVSELEFDPGSFFYDEKEKKLYVASERQKDPRGSLWTIAVIGKSGLHLENPANVVIDGLTATGFYRAMVRRPAHWVDDYQWGIILDQPMSCTIRDCTAFLNCAGIGINNGRGNIIEDCLAHDNSAHNIQLFGGDNNADNVMRRCRAFRCEWGIDSYTDFSGPVRIENCVAWDHFMDYSTKGGNSEEFAFMEGCVALSDIRIHHLKNCIFGGGYNEYGRGGQLSKDNINFNEEENLNIDREFADPLNMDWRLQGDSRFRGARDDGKDRGVYPDHDYRIFFLAPNGNDENDGTSYAKAWRTLSRAAQELKPSDTLYLYEGYYRADGQISIAGNGADKIHIRGRGRDRVAITGDLNLFNSSSVEFERLFFDNVVNMSNCQDIAFTNCVFTGVNAERTAGLRIDHGLFFFSPLRLNGVSAVYLSGNIFANENVPGVILDRGENDITYSDYNSYHDAANSWSVGGKSTSLEDLRDSHDFYSVSLAPKFSLENHRLVLENTDAFAGRGPNGTNLGRNQEYEEKSASVVGPFLHSVSDTTANIEWWSSGPATCEIVWGDTPDMANSAVVLNQHKVSSVSVQTYRFTSFSLTGLKPGQKYYFAIRSVRPVTAGTAMPLAITRPDAPPLEFTTTAAAPAPKTYYVATDGDDGNDGLSRQNALKTVGYAASRVNAGDTVMVAGGVYSEMVRLRASGSPEKPITFRCMPGEKVIFDGDERRLGDAFVLNRKENVHLDGFYFRNYALPVIAVFNGRDVKITRCFSDGRGPGYAGPLLIVRNSENIIVRNCVSIAGFGEGIYITNVPNMLIENNVFLRNLIFAFVLENDPDEKVTLRRSVCADSLPFKSQVPYFTIAHIESLVERDNCYYMRLPDEQRAMLQFYEDADRFGGRDRIGLIEYQKTVGDTGSYYGNPWFKGTIGMKEGDTTIDRGTEYPVLLSDKILGKQDLDFDDLFATDPKAVEKGIGLIAEDFKDCEFEQ